MNAALERIGYNTDIPQFRKAIDGAFSKAEPAGARHDRHDRLLNIERVKFAKEAFAETEGLEFLAQKEKTGGPEDIIFGYILG